MFHVGRNCNSGTAIVKNRFSASVEHRGQNAEFAQWMSELGVCAPPPSPLFVFFESRRRCQCVRQPKSKTQGKKSLCFRMRIGKGLAYQA